ncbi:MAG: site-specific DNA-methyltransferase [Pseudodesulfovibrio sp.]|nr:site-specific DNA-methyltransferase [Pseudodesulfovibrio sp.]
MINTSTLRKKLLKTTAMVLAFFYTYLPTWAICRLFCGDSFEYMKKCKCGKFDAVVTDIPYNVLKRICPGRI